MAEKEIALLRRQIEVLSDKSFDLEAWKNHTEIYLEEIFGKDSTVSKMIRALKYDYSSWNLRDVSGAGKPANPVLIQAREILEAAIDSLQKFGIPDTKDDKKKVWILIEEEMTGKQVKELRSILQSDDPEKENKISKIFETLDNQVLAKIIAGVLLP